MGIAGADVQAVVAAQALEPHPDVGLHVLDDVPEVGRAVGVRQGARDEQGAWRGSAHVRKPAVKMTGNYATGVLRPRTVRRLSPRLRRGP